MATYQTIVLMNLSKWENPNKPGTGFSLDVVQLVKDGKSTGIGVEKVYYKDGGAKRICKPLGHIDLNRVWEKKAEIKAYVNNPPAVAPPPEPEPLTGGSMGGGSLGGGSLGGGSLGGGRIADETPGESDPF